jgi:hypothetical protein
MALDVLDDLKRQSPGFFEEDNWDECAKKNRDAHFMYAILQGMQTGLAIGHDHLKV